MLLMDDPYDGEKTREEVIRWWKECISDRLKNMTSSNAVIIMTKLYNPDKT